MILEKLKRIAEKCFVLATLWLCLTMALYVSWILLGYISGFETSLVKNLGIMVQICTRLVLVLMIPILIHISGVIAKELKKMWNGDE
jgi:hypothetical protein